MELIRKLIACASLLAVAGCASTYGGGPLTADGEIRGARDLRATTEFNENLRAGYLELAEAGVQQLDYIDAGIFARKARLAGENENIQPEVLENWGVPEDLVPELAQARSQLVAALDGNARQNAPEPAARAQVMFDCWVEKAESVYWLIPDCDEGFQQAMAELEPRPMAEPAPAPPAPAVEPPARDYLVFFDFDRSEIRSDAAEVLRNVVDAIRELDAQTVHVIGHTDRAGPPEYNQGLSERRADSVRRFLTDQGVPGGLITTEGRGELDNRVPTPDGVREQENRRSEIRLD